MASLSFARCRFFSQFAALGRGTDQVARRRSRVVGIRERSSRGRCWPPTWRRSSARCGSTCRATATPRTITLVAGASVRCTATTATACSTAAPATTWSASPATTDVLGQYRFSGLGAGKYFVKLTLPPALQAKAGGDVKEINITAADADGTIGQTIDGFDSHPEGRGRAAAAVQRSTRRRSTRPSWAASATCSSS